MNHLDAFDVRDDDRIVALLGLRRATKEGEVLESKLPQLIPELDARLVPDLIFDLAVRRLAKRDRGSLAGVLCSVTQTGDAELARLQALAERPSARVRFTMDRYLYWLYAQIEDHGASPTPDEYYATGPTMFGVPVSLHEIDRAAGRLSEDGFIDGPGAAQRSGPLRPRLTARGRRVVEQRGSASADEASITQHVYNTAVLGNANVANNSSGTTQTISVNDEWLDLARQLIDAARTSSQDAAVQAAAIDLEREVDGEQRPLALRAALEALRDVTLNAVGGGLGTVLATHATALLTVLGG